VNHVSDAELAIKLRAGRGRPLRSLVPRLLARGSSPPGWLVDSRIALFAGFAGWRGPLGDAQRERSLCLVTAPDRQGATGGDFFNQSVAQEFADRLFGGDPLEVGRKVNGAILAL
jgi:hypothetical protein